MGIIDDYFSGSSATDNTPTPKTSGSVINQYMSSEDTPIKKPTEKTIPFPVGEGRTIQYIPESEYKKGVHTTGPHTPELPSLTENISNRFSEGVNLAGQGVGDIFSGKPATGVGKIGLGGLSALTSIPTGAADTVNQATGSDIGTRALLVTPAAPTVTAARAINAARPSNKAFSSLVQMIEPQNAGKVAAEMRADPRLTPADLSPAVKQATQQLFVTEGDKAKNYIAGFANDRASGTNAAVNTALDASLGSRVDPAAKLDQLKANIVNAGKQAIEPALNKTGPVDITPIVEHIDSVLKPGVNQIISNPENMLPYTRVQQTLEKWRDFITNDKVNLTDPNALHKIQSGIRRQADGLVKSSDPEARATGYALYGLRNEFINAIGKAGPQTVDKAGNAVSEYRAGLSKFRDENDVADAFRHGHDSIIKNGKALEDNPEFFQRWVSNVTPEEKEAAKEGANIAIRTATNAYRAPVTNPASKAIQMSQIAFNRDRIEALFGKEQAETIFKKLENERKIAETNNDLIHGSQTAMRSAANEHVALPEKSNGLKSLIGPAAAEAMNLGGAYFTGGTIPGAGAALYVGARAGAAIKDKIAMAMAKERNVQLAKYALPTQGPDREELIRNLEAVATAQQNRTPRLSLINRARLAVSP